MQDRTERHDEERPALRPPLPIDDWFVGGDYGHVDGAALGAAIELRKLRLAGVIGARRGRPEFVRTGVVTCASVRAVLIDHFDEPVAAHYEATEAVMFEPAAVDPAVTVLTGLAGNGRALELGIGTGRLALPLHGRGVPVHGIDLSIAMVARLRAKPGADGIDVTIGDFATTVVPGTFRVAYLVFNTITNLTTQDAQVACFENAARHLEPGGTFVIEVFVPALPRLSAGETVRAHPPGPTRLDFDEYDVAAQTLRSHHHRLRDGTWTAWSLPFRYVWPAELDLMARIAGMRLRERWADWQGAPFTSASEQHVSIWEKAG